MAKKVDWTDSPLMIGSRRHRIVCGGDFYDRQKNIRLDFSNWEQCINGNVNLLVFVGLLLIGATFVAVGYFRNRRMK